MYWTFEARSYLEQAQWPTTKKDLIEYLTSCTDVPEELIKALQELDVDEHELFYSVDEMWDGLPQLSDYCFNEDEY